MGHVHDLPSFASPTEREAERAAFFEHAWAQKHARDAADAAEAAEAAKAARAVAAPKKVHTQKHKGIAKKPTGKGVVAESGEESD
jgi:hypothetical protein